ncbi:DUF1145 domain-containing protein [Pseudomonas sp. LS44]|uniref:DUF1145 domain-containing protein n=1 Tax=Pseudomonas sp. LS44 TaxID=1357074 RepID=UPI00215A976F|nr:DUF1145 domain-containing protein [Pseudomonas sp. LS44]UVE18753.1 DUF1145 domain-containing protein [Pseudomonas sp. LS44]
MKALSFAKGVLAMFWLVAVLNVIFPFSAPLHGWLLAVSGIMLLVHIVEVLLFNSRLAARPQPWLERVLVLLFGVLHLKTLRQQA